MHALDPPEWAVHTTILVATCIHEASNYAMHAHEDLSDME